MDVHSFDIKGPIELSPHRFADERGYFSEIFRHDEFSDRVAPVDFVQVNESLSVHAGTIRGIHFQIAPKAQGKLVRCVAGSIFDVAVDLQHNSPSFGQWVGVTLSASAGNQLWIPAGFGHAFVTLEAQTTVSYRVTDYYSRDCDKGLAWDDPDIAIEWPGIADPQTLSAKDRQQPSLSQLPAYFNMDDSRCA